MTHCIFEPRTDTSSATICKHCGQEKILHNHNIQVPQLYNEYQVRQAIRKAQIRDEYGIFLYPFEDEIIELIKQPKKD